MVAALLGVVDPFDKGIGVSRSVRQGLKKTARTLRLRKHAGKHAKRQTCLWNQKRQGSKTTTSRTTFQKAFDITQVAEVADKSARDLQWSQEGVEAEEVKVMNSREDKPSCHRCNGQHRPVDC
ncbi:hypothetical protein EMCRGX_G011336 [Ephydatia muelleri]